ncbi:MAG: ABC transporter ATP-binding protein/permease [Oscillospiraceae bacterium]|nr:ABC transporter ATP-binding protein/permease [Oscillospiraceae bacterium]
MYRYLRQNKGLLILCIILCVLAAGASASVALILQLVLDIAISGEMGQFTQALIFSVIYFILIGLLSYFTEVSCLRLTVRTLRVIRDKVFAGIMRQNMEQFHKVNSADYLSALNNDIKLIEDNYLTPLFVVIFVIPLFLSSVAVMLYFDFIVTIVVFFSSFLMLLVPGLLGKALQKRQDQFSQKMSGFMIRLKDFLSGFEVVKTYRMLPFVRKQIERENADMAKAQYRAGRLLVLNSELSKFLGMAIQVTTIFLSAYFIIIGRITAGVLVGLIQAGGSLVMPLMMALQELPKLKGCAPILERLNGFADHENTSFTGTKTPTFETGISISDLRFGYKEDEPVLRGLSLQIDRGKKYAVIGKSGSGKSTLAKLLAGYYSGFDGEIAYDGTNLRELDIEKLGEMSATIHQNIYLFDDTIEENIRLHKEYSKEALERALSISGVDLFLDGESKGLSSPVGENGSELSGGQRQRVAVARALIQEKPILTLDEGTSSLDMQTAYDIESRLLGMDDLTLITITHSLNPELLQAYDSIIFLVEGKVAEMGSYAVLMEGGGAFADYCAMGQEIEA